MEKFAIKINGVIMIPNIATRALAESALLSLPPEQRMLAEIVPMTPDGKQILFG